MERPQGWDIKGLWARKVQTLLHEGTCLGLTSTLCFALLWAPCIGSPGPLGWVQLPGHIQGGRKGAGVSYCSGSSGFEEGLFPGILCCGASLVWQLLTFARESFRQQQRGRFPSSVPHPSWLPVAA